MSKPVAFPGEAWELRRDLRAYEGEIALLSRTNDELARELAEAHRENVALRAQVARAARQGPRWYATALAALWCGVEALGERINRAWAHEGWR